MGIKQFGVGVDEPGVGACNGEVHFWILASDGPDFHIEGQYLGRCQGHVCRQELASSKRLPLDLVEAVMKYAIGGRTVEELESLRPQWKWTDQVWITPRYESPDG